MENSLFPCKAPRASLGEAIIFESFPMRWHPVFAIPFALLLSAFTTGPATETKAAPEPQTAPQTLAVLPLDYVDTSGEVTDQSAAHEKRASDFVRNLKDSLAASGRYRVIDLMCGAQPCSPKSDPTDVQKAATDAGVRLVVMGGVHKMSTLVQWGKIQVIDEQSGKILSDKLISFRGDTDESWKRAQDFVTRDILATNFMQTVLGGQKPIKLVVFPFELLDFSGGAAIIAESEQDRQALEASTNAARKLIATSGRYTLVGGDALQNPGEKLLRECGGCEAEIAKTLGGEQSLLGIITRITRTDYAVTYRLRDAKNGELVSVGQTDLRIGANYSWDRGAIWLIKNQFLKEPE